TPNGYPTASTFGLNGTTNNYDINGSSSSALTGYASNIDGNPNLKWETAETLDVALEFGLLNNSLNVEVGYYNKKTKDLLVQLTRPATAGLAENPFVNIGESSNKGVEFAINYDGRISNGFGIQAGINMSFNKNEVTGLNPDNAEQFLPTFDFRGNTVTRIQKGFPISYFYGYDIEGFYSSQTEVDRLDQSNGVVGGFKYRDIDGDGKITSDDRTQIGSPHPDAIYGINLGFSYDQFSLTFFADGTVGNEIYDFKKYFTDLHFFPGALKTTVLDSWSPNNLNATVPLISNDVTGQEIPSSFYIEDGSYFRMRNINLNYNLPSSILSNLNIASANIYFQVDNAFVITKYSGLDPEINVLNDPNNPRSDQNLGIDRGAYPNPRSFILGLNISLQ
ncbi:TonB-dependent receptor, partial [Flavobacteriaceae bacterium]|nr:TonB-dependent receptor [Flavobacteriaceae bacterium]